MVKSNCSYCQMINWPTRFVYVMFILVVERLRFSLCVRIKEFCITLGLTSHRIIVNSHSHLCMFITVKNSITVKKKRFSSTFNFKS